jgi:hypothetical protein
MENNQDKPWNCNCTDHTCQVHKHPYMSGGIEKSTISFDLNIQNPEPDTQAYMDSKRNIEKRVGSGVEMLS